MDDGTMQTMNFGTKNLLRSTAIAILPLTATAQVVDLDELISLGTVVVTAAGVETTTATAPGSVTVITSDQLEQAGVTDLTDALRSVPGVSVAGGADAENIYIRGFPAEYSLILVDGKRQDTRESRTNGSGGVDQYYIPPASAIERIEVVRGPMSSLYGSEAMGGVINIITKPVSPTWSGSVTIEGVVPEHDEDSAERQISYFLDGPVVDDRIGLQVWGRLLDREQSDREESGRSVGPSARTLSDVHARLIFAPSIEDEYSLELGRTEMYSDPRLNSRTSAALGYEGVRGLWDLTATLSWEHAARVTDGSDRRPEVENTIFDVKGSRFVDWNGVHEVTIGAQIVHNALTDENPGLDDGEHYSFDNTQTAIFAEDIWDIRDDVTLTYGARYTVDERFGGKITPRAHGLWEVSDNTFLTAAVATGYRTPDLRESVEDYYLTTNRGAAVIAGNPDLEPEESTSYELGLRRETETASFAATLYHSDLINRIETRDTGTTTTVGTNTYDLYEYYNVGRAKLQGFELSGSYDVSDTLRLSGSYSYTHSERLTGDLAGYALARTPDHQIGFKLDWVTPVEGLEVWGSVDYFGESVAVSSTSRGNTITEYDGYTTVDIGANYALTDTVSVSAALYNLADAEITNADHGSAKAGRSLWVAITAEF
jgi:outer membrane receptor for ferrienterochelin and colicins